jgi:hypothetical protein
MLPEGKVREIEGLLREGRLSQRRIAVVTETSRGTVAKIAQGKRPDYAALRGERERDEWPDQGEIGRCPGCGARVYLPCRACRMRRIL